MSVAVACMLVSALLLIGPAIRKRIESRAGLSQPPKPARKRPTKKKEPTRERKG